MVDRTIRYEHSTDYGRNWHEITPEPRSPVIALLADREANEVYDDEYGNFYRWSYR